MSASNFIASRVRLAEPRAAAATAALQPALAAKDQSVDTLRGLAIVLMIAGHVIGARADSGLRVPEDSFFRYFYYSLSYLRMPLFTCISGYVYAMRPVGDYPWHRFASGKARRLLLPMATVGSLQFLVGRLTPGVNHRPELGEIWQIYFFGFAQFWFLQAVFLIFMVVLVLEKARLMDRVHVWTACLLVSMIGFFYCPRIGVFSDAGAWLLVPFFILGVGLARFPLVLNQPAFRFAAVMVLAMGLTAQQVAWFRPDVLPLKGLASQWLLLIVGLTGNYALFQIRPTLASLVWFGTHAYAIYLFHVFGTAGARIVLTRLEVQNAPIVFTTSLAAGLVLPILAELVLVRWWLTRRLFLGLR